jgi:hypothetical protein
LIIALLTASLLPTDVILVSFMKNPNGTFKVKDNQSKVLIIQKKIIFLKEWTSNQTTRDEIQKYVEIGYYGMFIIIEFRIVNGR